MLDRPSLSTDDKFDSVYEVDTEVVVLEQTLPDEERITIDASQVVEHEQGTLQYDRDANPECEDLNGQLVTFEWPFVLQTGLIAREDVLIQHNDGFQEVVRPYRLGEFMTSEAEPLCFNGDMTMAL